jgi:hypothetical protein
VRLSIGINDGANYVSAQPLSIRGAKRLGPKGLDLVWRSFQVPPENVTLAARANADH